MLRPCSFLYLCCSWRYFRFCLLSSLSRKIIPPFNSNSSTLGSDLLHPHESHLRTINTPTEHFDVDAVGPEVVHSKSIDRQMAPWPMQPMTGREKEPRSAGEIYKNVTLDDIFKEKWNLCLEEMIHGYFRPLNIRNLCFTMVSLTLTA